MEEPPTSHSQSSKRSLISDILAGSPANVDLANSNSPARWFRKALVPHENPTLRTSALGVLTLSRRGVRFFLGQLPQVLNAHQHRRLPMEELPPLITVKPTCSHPIRPPPLLVGGINPDEAVAYGAAVQAAILSGDISEFIDQAALTGGSLPQSKKTGECFFSSTCK
ncbi:hypothetical protein PQX77_003519 [Marasmius sp. AFHP31]|nr:hypothetical protein PQX77_003519 [Marasmius sp. AFHP31]